MFCKKCGNQINEGQRFCSRCGEKIEFIPAPAVQENVAPKKQPKNKKAKNKKGLIIGIIAGLLVIVAAIVGILFATGVLGDDAKNSDVDTEDVIKDDDKNDEKEPTDEQEEPQVHTGIPLEKIKVGFIYLHGETSSFDKNFMDAALSACNQMGVAYAQRTDVAESEECYEAAKDLIETEGCNIIFADSFGHEDYLIKAAREYPEVEFCHAAGVKAHTENLQNFHNAYAEIYEGWYLNGVAAGLKLNEMISKGEINTGEAKLGYVGAYPYAEVISSYTAFYLGAKSVCPTVTMDVKYADSWYDETRDNQIANELIDGGCLIMGQYSDSMGVPKACESRGVPYVAYNYEASQAITDTFLAGSRIDWTPYFKYIIQCVNMGEEIATDWAGTLQTGSVVVSMVNDSVAPAGTQQTVNEVKKELESDMIEVFDTSFWTVNGETYTSYLADVDTDGNFMPDTHVIENGIFYESKYRSAPYFNIQIDGITIINQAY